MISTARSVANTIAEWGESKFIHSDLNHTRRKVCPAGSAERLLDVLRETGLRDLEGAFATCMQGDARVRAGKSFPTKSEFMQYTRAKRHILLLKQVWNENERGLSRITQGHKNLSSTDVSQAVLILSIFDNLASRSFTVAYDRACAFRDQRNVKYGDKLVDYCALAVANNLAKRGRADLLNLWIERCKYDGVDCVSQICKMYKNTYSAQFKRHYHGPFLSKIPLDIANKARIVVTEMIERNYTGSLVLIEIGDNWPKEAEGYTTYAIFDNAVASTIYLKSKCGRNFQLRFADGGDYLDRLAIQQSIGITLNGTQSKPGHGDSDTV